jgi:hypothetical protein
MSACCNMLSSRSGNESPANVATDGLPAPSSRPRRSLTLTRWSLPGLVLILLPKCPACLAAYIALGTGLSLSVAASFYLRWYLLALCVAAIALNVFSFFLKARRRLLSAPVKTFSPKPAKRIKMKYFAHSENSKLIRKSFLHP